MSIQCPFYSIYSEFTKSWSKLYDRAPDNDPTSPNGHDMPTVGHSPP